MQNLTVPLISVIGYTVPSSDSDSYFLIVRSHRYGLYEVSVNGDHKTYIIST